MHITKVIPVLVYLLVTTTITAQSNGILIDARDGKKYKTVTYTLSKDGPIDAITWMAENLNFFTEASFCQEDSISNCDTYGRLYTWFEAKKVCPKGWHLPSDEEWYQLANVYGGVAVAGKHLKSNGSNKSSFEGLLGGMRDAYDGRFYKLGTAGFFWSATESPNNPDEAYDWSVASWSETFRHWEGGKLIGNSCRCIKDKIEY